MKLIAGDVGGTKTLLQFIDGVNITTERRFESGRYATFDDLLREFARDCPKADSACFAVAGPVINGRAEITNLHWVMEESALASEFAIPRLSLINDFYAVALGVPLLQPTDLLSLQKGRRERGAPIGILGAGTGLGEAMVTFRGEVWNVVPSEGGHADFAPQDEQQSALFIALHNRFGHVSWERLLSGMGLVNIFTFLGGENVDPSVVAERASEGDPLALEAFRIFVDIYGAEAGNLALRVLARGGVFLAGGVAAKNSSHFTDGRFIEAFLRKGRFRDVLEAIPVDLITNERVGVMGAGEMARRNAEG